MPGLPQHEPLFKGARRHRPDEETHRVAPSARLLQPAFHLLEETAEAVRRRRAASGFRGDVQLRPQLAAEEVPSLISRPSAPRK